MTWKHFVMRGRGAFLARLAARRRVEACHVGKRASGGTRVWTPRARAEDHVSTFTRRSDDAARRGFAASRSWVAVEHANPRVGRAFASAASSPPPPTRPTDAESPRVVEIEEAAQLRDIVASATERDVGLVFDFYADWCGPCKTLTPMLEDAVTKSPPRTKADGTVAGPSVVLVKVNVDKHAGIADELKIKSLPTVMTMRGGDLVDSVAGTMSSAEVDALVAAAAASASAEPPSPTSSPSSPPSTDPTDAVNRAFALLDAPSASSADDAAAVAAAAADAVNAALAAGEALPPAARARAYAAAARCALLARPPDVAGADAMVASARQAVGGNFPEPEEIAAAEARARLTERAAEAGRLFFGDDGDDTASRLCFPDSAAFAAKLEALDSETGDANVTSDDENDADADETFALRESQKHLLRRARAAVLALEGDAAGAAAAALAATRASKGDEREAARVTCVAVFDAFGQKHPEAVAGKRKLANLWFL